MATYEITTEDGAVYEIETGEANQQPSRMDQAKSIGGEIVNRAVPGLGRAVGMANYAVNNPRQAAINVADYLPAAEGIALPVAGAALSGGSSIPASVGLSGLGMASGEAHKQLIRRAMGVEAAPPVEKPFTPGTIPRIPGISPEASNIVTQGGLGAAYDVGGQALRVIPKVGRGVINAVSPSGIKAVDIAERYKNPVGVKTALNREQLGNVLVEQHKTLGQQISALDNAAKQTLDANPTIPKSKVIQMLKEIKGKFVGSSGKAVTAETKSAVNAVDDVVGAIKDMNPIPDIPGKTGLTVGPSKLLETKTTPAVVGRSADNISEQQLKDLMSQYKNVPWNDPSANAQKEVRKFLDYILKKNNPKYAEAMKPVAERTKVQSLIEKKMSLKYDPTTGTYATDATAGKWTPKLLEGKRPETSIALKKLDKLTKGNILEKTRLTNIREVFEGGKTTGSRMVQLGRHIAGGPGALAGAIMDKAGGAVTGGMVDALRLAAETVGLPLNAPTASAILKALASMKKDKTNAAR